MSTNTTTVRIEREIAVDVDIAGEVRWLNKSGIMTEGSCSGHGCSSATAVIRPSSVERVEELGYVTRYLADTGLYEIKLRGSGFEVTRRETGKQPYTNAEISAGVVEGHAYDVVYLRFEREGENPVMLYLRRDEAAAAIWLLAGAMWSEEIGMA